MLCILIISFHKIKVLRCITYKCNMFLETASIWCRACIISYGTHVRDIDLQIVGLSPVYFLKNVCYSVLIRIFSVVGGCLLVEIQFIMKWNTLLSFFHTFCDPTWYVEFTRFITSFFISLCTFV